MVGYGRFLMVLRGFFVDFLWVFAKFLWVRKTTCGYLFHKPTHGFASFPTQILMENTHKNTSGFCVTFPVLCTRSSLLDAHSWHTI